MNPTTIGLDLAKSVFQVHGVDNAGVVAITKKLRRAEVLRFFTSLERCLVGMEACATAHFWAREIGALGHEVRMMPPAYVKGYVRWHKNDAADAAATCEAVSQPSMRFVPVKSAEGAVSSGRPLRRKGEVSTVRLTGGRGRSRPFRRRRPR